jgi:hypothetical protein
MFYKGSKVTPRRLSQDYNNKKKQVQEGWHKWELTHEKHQEQEPLGTNPSKKPSPKGLVPAGTDPSKKTKSNKARYQQEPTPEKN